MRINHKDIFHDISLLGFNKGANNSGADALFVFLQ